jgi:hypothetical protein
MEVIMKIEDRKDRRYIELSDGFRVRDLRFKLTAEEELEFYKRSAHVVTYSRPAQSKQKK